MAGRGTGKRQSLHLALVDSNSETRHIQLVTAVETLLREQARPQPVLNALENFVEDVKRWPDSEDSEKELKKRITEILKNDKEESINRAGSEQVAAMLAGEYFDKSAGAFFKHAYDLRSRLVHRERLGTVGQPLTKSAQCNRNCCDSS